MDNSNDDSISRIFNQEVIEKGRIARGIHHRASRKKGFKGQVRFESDNLSRREIKQLSSEVVTYNIYDYLANLGDYQHFKLKGKEIRQNILSNFLKKFTIEDVAEHWKLSSSKIWKIVNDLNIDYQYNQGGENNSMGNNVSVTTILSYEDFLKLSKEERREKLTSYLKNFSKKEITKVWIKSHRIYDAARGLGMIDAVKQNTETFSAEKNSNRIQNITTPEKTDTIESMSFIVKPEVKEVKETKPLEFKSTFTLENEKMSGEELKQRIEGLGHTIFDNKNYVVSIILKEIK
jgi:hypothetical protein